MTDNEYPKTMYKIIFETGKINPVTIIGEVELLFRVKDDSRDWVIPLSSVRYEICDDKITAAISYLNYLDARSKEIYEEQAEIIRKKCKVIEEYGFENIFKTENENENEVANKKEI